MNVGKPVGNNEDRVRPRTGRVRREAEVFDMQAAGGRRRRRPAAQPAAAAAAAPAAEPADPAHTHTHTHNLLGRLKMRDMKIRDGQKCRGGKCET